MFKSEHIYLRPVEREDANRIVIWENDIHNWRVTETEAPYSLGMILNHIENCMDFRHSGVLRLIICLNNSDESIGIVDIYDVNFKHERGSVGILIGEKEERKKGYALEALLILQEYATKILDFHNLTASVLEDNKDSIRLFENAGYSLIGTRKDWFKDKDKRIDERIYQICLKKENDKN
jgi:diamine N-acetyltransferase